MGAEPTTTTDPLASHCCASWHYEDELPEGYPYDLEYPRSKVVDGVRMFPPMASVQDEKATALLIRKYHETVESFLRSIGVTEDTAMDYEFRTQQGDHLSGEFWHNGERAGVVLVRFYSDDPSKGYRWVVECFAA